MPQTRRRLDIGIALLSLSLAGVWWMKENFAIAERLVALKVADVLQDEQVRLMPNPKPFDGYVEVPARVSSTALVHLQRNRYSRRAVERDRSA